MHDDLCMLHARIAYCACWQGRCSCKCPCIALCSPLRPSPLPSMTMSRQVDSHCNAVRQNAYEDYGCYGQHAISLLCQHATHASPYWCGLAHQQSDASHPPCSAHNYHYKCFGYLAVGLWLNTKSFRRPLTENSTAVKGRQLVRARTRALPVLRANLLQDANWNWCACAWSMHPSTSGLMTEAGRQRLTKAQRR